MRNFFSKAGAAALGFLAIVGAYSLFMALRPGQEANATLDSTVNSILTGLGEGSWSSSNTTALKSAFNAAQERADGLLGEVELTPGPQGDTGATGSTGSTGATGATGPSTVGVGTAISPTLGTAFQAQDNTKPAVVVVNVTSTATITLSGGQTHSAQLVIAPTSGAACTAGTGSRILGRYSNSNTGTLTIGLSLSNILDAQLTAPVPAGYWVCARVTAGSPSIVSAFDQSVG